MHIFFLASLIFAHLLSVSATKDVPLGLDDSTPVDLRALCEAPEPDYEAIRQAAEREDRFSPAVAYCLDIFSEGNNVSGLETLRGSGLLTSFWFFSPSVEKALKHGRIDALMFFFELDAVIDTDGAAWARMAAEIGQLDAVSRLMSHEKFPHADEYAVTAVLNSAIKYGHADIVDWILSKYMTVSQDELRWHAWDAHQYKQWHIIPILIKHGLNINVDTGRMPEIRNAYNEWNAQKQIELEGLHSTLSESFPQDVLGIAGEYT